jgi:heme-degrading monooxygenase HmoA
MIARIWHGYTKLEHADAYEAMLKPELLPGISKAKGYGGSYLLRRKAEDEVEFITIMLWDSIDAIRAVAGHRRPTAAWLVWGLLWGARNVGRSPPSTTATR